MKQSKLLTLITALGTSLILTACGGGSTSTVSESNNLSLETIDSTNQKQATAVLFDSIDITTPQLPSISTDTNGLAKVSAPLLKGIKGTGDNDNPFFITFWRF